ncbi:MAG TPA: hypothetical protein VIL52_02635 [Bacteroidota bacterium]
MKNRLKLRRNEELRQAYFALVNPDRKGGPLTKYDALEQVLKVAREKYLITSESTLQFIIFGYGYYKPRHCKISAG